MAHTTQSTKGAWGAQLCFQIEFLILLATSGVSNYTQLQFEANYCKRVKPPHRSH